MSSNLLSILLATLILHCAGCSTGVPSVEYQVPVVREFKVLDQPAWPGRTSLVRYRIGFETVSIPVGTDFSNTPMPLSVTVSEGDIVPLLPSVYNGQGDAPAFEDAEAAWQASGNPDASGTGHPAYQEPFIYFLYQAPANDQNVRIELNLGNDGGPGNRGHSDAFLVQWPLD